MTLNRLGNQKIIIKNVIFNLKKTILYIRLLRQIRIVFFIITQIWKKTTCFCEIFDCTMRKPMLEYILGKDGN